MDKYVRLLPAVLFCGLFVPAVCLGQKGIITLASATTTENAGLYSAILPTFTQQTGIDVRVLSVGTGHAINIARSGDAEVLLVHHKPSEEKFVADGYGLRRFDLMYNDFLLVGPADDPAGIAGQSSADQALRNIFYCNCRFVSRGDDSGTHKMELALWQDININRTLYSGNWYLETGGGMGTTLNVASAMGAYTFVDRGTWLRYSVNSGLTTMVEDDPKLYNQYGVVLANPALHPKINSDEEQIFLKWLLSKQGQSAINDFKINGQQAFVANALE